MNYYLKNGLIIFSGVVLSFLCITGLIWVIVSLVESSNKDTIKFRQQCLENVNSEKIENFTFKCFEELKVTTKIDFHRGLFHKCRNDAFIVYCGDS